MQSQLPRLRFSIVVALALAVRLGAPAAAQLPGLRPDRLDQIRKVVEAEMAALRIPGVSVAVADDYRLVWEEGFGIADLEHSVPAKAGTVYRIASISKPITAVAAMQLSERGLLDLDAPIQKYVPSFPEKEWKVTARQLLSHTAGIRHYSNAAEINSTRHYTDMLEPLRVFRDDPLLFQPGTRFSYSTYGYSLLGAAVESAAGKPFFEYVKENVLAPAKMANTRQDDVYEIVPDRARGYRLGRGGRVLNCDLADTSNKVPGGGMLSTVEDLVRFAIAFQRGVLLKPETVERMTTPPRLADGSISPYALGWNVVERGGRKWVLHSGGQQGTSTLLVTVPSQGVAVAAMANLEQANISRLVARVTEIVLQ